VTLNFIFEKSCLDDKTTIEFPNRRKYLKTQSLND
jgi:hypothetical protein